MKDIKDSLEAIYNDFETAAAAPNTEAACGQGCAFCCTDAGSIHITSRVKSTPAALNPIDKLDLRAE